MIPVQTVLIIHLLGLGFIVAPIAWTLGSPVGDHAVVAWIEVKLRSVAWIYITKVNAMPWILRN